MTQDRRQEDQGETSRQPGSGRQGVSPQRGRRPGRAWGSPLPGTEDPSFGGAPYTNVQAHVCVRVCVCTFTYVNRTDTPSHAGTREWGLVRVTTGVTVPGSARPAEAATDTDSSAFHLVSKGNTSGGICVSGSW